MTATPIGARKLPSAEPQLSAIGIMPAPMAMVVITIGRARLWQASSSASSLFMGSTASWVAVAVLPRRASMAYSTSKIEFLVAMPISMISPISEGMEKLLSASSSAANAPPSDKGSAARMVNGCRKSLNNNTSTM